MLNTQAICDRCDSIENMRKKDELPKGWAWANNAKLLCGACLQDLDAFFRGARIEFEHVARPDPDRGLGEK